jgi:hypothetical protein
VLQRPGCFAFIYYALLDPALPALIVLATLIAYFFHNLMFVSVAALTAVFHSPPAVQRDVNWFSVCDGVLRRAGATDRDGTASMGGIEPGDSALHIWLRRREYRSGSCFAGCQAQRIRRDRFSLKPMGCAPRRPAGSGYHRFVIAFQQDVTRGLSRGGIT